MAYGIKRVQMLQENGTYMTIAQIEENQTVHYMDYLMSQQFYDIQKKESEIQQRTDNPTGRADFEAKLLKITQAKLASVEFGKPALRVVPMWELNQLNDPVSVH